MAGVGAAPVVLTVKLTCQYATSGPLPANDYSLGNSGGIGSTLIGTGNGALTVDGQAVEAGQRILVADEVILAHNGIYDVIAAGTATSPYVLQRSGDCDTPSTITSGMVVPIGAAEGALGVANNATLWTAVCPEVVIVGVTDLTFALVTAAPPVTPITSPVSLATAAPLPSVGYNNGAAGVGATLTASATGVVAVDGVNVADGDTILVKNQSAQLQNGVYVVTQAGAVGVPLILTRSPEMDQPSQFRSIVPIGPGGDTNADTFWQGQPTGTVVIGTTPVPFAPFAGGGTFTWNTGAPQRGDVAAILESADGSLIVTQVDDTHVSVTQAVTPITAPATLATAVPLPTVVYANGASGVGATLTASATGVVAVDGVNVAAGDLILVKNQGAPLQNGLYTVTQAGALGVPLILTRSVEMDLPAQFRSIVPVGPGGTANADSFWQAQPSGTVVVGTTPIPFALFGGATDFPATHNLDMNGFKLVNEADPTFGTDVANKRYVDTSALPMTQNGDMIYALSTPLLFEPVAITSDAGTTSGDLDSLWREGGFWQPNSNSFSIFYDMGSALLVGAVRFSARELGGISARVFLARSDDGITYTGFGDLSGYPVGAPLEDITVTVNQTHRYWRLHFADDIVGPGQMVRFQLTGATALQKVRLAIGGAGQFLRTEAGEPQWTNLASADIAAVGGIVNPMTTAGDMMFGGPVTPTHSVVNTGNDQSGIATGPFGAPMPTGNVDRTWRVWYKGTDPAASPEGLLWVGTADTTKGFGIYLTRTGNDLALRPCNNTVNPGGLTGGTLPNVWDGLPHMIEAVFDHVAGTVQCRVDGVNIAAPWVIGGSGLADGSPAAGKVTIGRDDPSSPLQMEINDGVDEVSIFPAALTQAQSAADYAARAGDYRDAVLSHSPVAYWKFDNPADYPVVTDTIGNFPLTYGNHVDPSAPPLADGTTIGYAQRLPIGTAGQQLAVVAGIPTWAKGSSGWTATGAAASPNATHGVNGAPVSLPLDAGFTRLEWLQSMSLTYAGLGAETVQATITATYDDATTATVTDSAPADTVDSGSSDLAVLGIGGLIDLTPLIKSGHDITALTVACQSTVDGSVATVTPAANGIERG